MMYLRCWIAIGAAASLAACVATEPSFDAARDTTPTAFAANDAPPPAAFNNRQATPVIFSPRETECAVPYEGEVYRCVDDDGEPYAKLWAELDRKHRRAKRDLARREHELAVLKESLRSSTLVRIDHVKQALFDLGHYDADKNKIIGFHGPDGFNKIIRSQSVDDFAVAAAKRFQCASYPPNNPNECEPSRKSGWLTFFQARHALCLAGYKAQGPAARVVADWFARGKVYDFSQYGEKKRKRTRNEYAYYILQKYAAFAEAEAARIDAAAGASPNRRERALLDYWRTELSIARAYADEVVLANLTPYGGKKDARDVADAVRAELNNNAPTQTDICPIPRGMIGNQ
ncbi:MAG: hypothetical protein ACFB00_12865 [Parvularculaceae bacterium]